MLQSAGNAKYMFVYSRVVDGYEFDWLNYDSKMKSLRRDISSISNNELLKHRLIKHGVMTYLASVDLRHFVLK